MKSFLRRIPVLAAVSFMGGNAVLAQEELGVLKLEAETLAANRAEAEQRVASLRREGRFREAATAVLTADRLRRREVAMEHAYKRALGYFRRLEREAAHAPIDHTLDEQRFVEPDMADRDALKDLVQSAAEERAAAEAYAAELKTMGKHREAAMAAEACERLREREKSLRKVFPASLQSGPEPMEGRSPSSGRHAGVSVAPETTAAPAPSHVPIAGSTRAEALRNFLDTIAQTREGMRDPTHLEGVLSHALALAHELALDVRSVRAAAAQRAFEQAVEAALARNAEVGVANGSYLEAEHFADGVNRAELAVESLALALKDAMDERPPPPSATPPGNRSRRKSSMLTVDIETRWRAAATAAGKNRAVITSLHDALDGALAAIQRDNSGKDEEAEALEAIACLQATLRDMERELDNV